MEKKARIYWSEQTESTNTDAWELASADSEHSANLSVIATRWQTAGRGQGDHKWHAAPGENLTFTIILRYDGRKGSFAPFPAAQQKAVSDLTAHAVVDYLAGHGVEAWIKQPNDVYVEGRKICGMLIKHCVRSGFLKYSILGIGININETEFPSDLPNPTSLLLELRRLGKDVNARYETDRELDRFLAVFESACARLFTEITED